MTLPFLILAALTIAGAVAAMSLRNLVHCVLALTLAFAGLAGIYLLLGRAVRRFCAGAGVYRRDRYSHCLCNSADARDGAEAIFLDTPASWRMSSVIVVAVFGVIVWAIRGSSALSQGNNS